MARDPENMISKGKLHESRKNRKNTGEKRRNDNNLQIHTYKEAAKRKGQLY